MLSRNLAHGKSTRQSSHYERIEPTARLIGDVVPQGYGVHTAVGDVHPWWEVDLGEPTAISRIIYLDGAKRPDRAAALLRISTSLDGEKYEEVYRCAGKPVGLVDIGAPVDARYVRVSLDNGGPLQFRQLIVV